MTRDIDTDRRAGRDRRADGGIHLTPREREVLALVLKGEPNKEIALLLGVAEQTAKQRVSDLLRKFGVPNRAAVADAGRAWISSARPLSAAGSRNYSGVPACRSR